MLIPAHPDNFVEIFHEIFSTVIPLLPLIPEGLLSVTSEVLVNRLYTISLCLPRESVVWLTYHLDMTIAVDCDDKPKPKQIKYQTLYQIKFIKLFTLNNLRNSPLTY